MLTGSPAAANCSSHVLRPTYRGAAARRTPGICRIRLSYAATLLAADAGAAAAIAIGLSDCWPNSALTTSATTRALCEVGSTFASIPLQITPRLGAATRASSAVVTSATAAGRRIIALALRYQRPLPSGSGRTLPMRAARSVSSAGRISSDAAAATSATTAPPMPIEIRNGCGKSVSTIIAPATATPL